MPRVENVPSSQPAVFRTAFGFPVCINWALALLQLVLAALHARGSDWQFAALFGALGVLMAMGLVAFMLTTKYRVLDAVLHLRMGFWSRRIPVDTIKSLSEYGIKKGRLYGLGSDLAAVECQGRPVAITPKDLDGLVGALGVPLTRLGDGKPPS